MKFSLIKKILICTPVLAAIPAIVIPAVQTTQNNKSKNNASSNILPGDKTTCENPKHKAVPKQRLSNEVVSIKYDLVSTKQHSIDCGSKRNNWPELKWSEMDDGHGKGFEEVRWCEPNKFLMRTEGHNKNDRFVYQQIKVNVTVPANVKDYKINFQGEVYEWWDCNYRFLCGSEYRSAIQMFDLGEDANAHPERFTNYYCNKNNVDSHSFLEHGLNKSCSGGMTGTDTYSSRQLSWSFNNDTNAPKTFSRYIGVSFWVNGLRTSGGGDTKADIKVGLRSSIDSIGEISHSLQKWGDIRVECRLTNADQTCHIDHYVDGDGTIIIPDHVTFCGRDYYVREIPSDWSNGSNNIRGLKFAKDVSHLKKICKKAFEGTNALDYYVNHKNELLVFPEGLEEIGIKAFQNCYRGFASIKGYSFPSTLKVFGERSFYRCPTIDGDNKNGELWFRSIPKFRREEDEKIIDLYSREYGGNKLLDVFLLNHFVTHSTKYIYGSTTEIATKMTNLVCGTYKFNLINMCIPRLINGPETINVQPTWGDIKVQCSLIGDECMLKHYVSGKGTLVVPDAVWFAGKTYYVKKIPTFWSDDKIVGGTHGANDITGLKFAPDCKHLKEICSNAFRGTNVLDYYVDHKNELLVFPEGLEEIGDDAFREVDQTLHHNIKGYSFPSTLKVIGEKCFLETSYINGDNSNGELWFRSIPKIYDRAFAVGRLRKIKCKYIYGGNIDIANKMVEYCKKQEQFATDDNLLTPKVIK